MSTKRQIAAVEAKVAAGDFTRSIFDWAMEVGLTFDMWAPRELVGRPLIAEHDGLRLVGEKGNKLLVGPEYSWLGYGGWVRGWLVEYDGPEVPTITILGVTGEASMAE